MQLMLGRGSWLGRMVESVLSGGCRSLSHRCCCGLFDEGLTRGNGARRRRFLRQRSTNSR